MTPDEARSLTVGDRVKWLGWTIIEGPASDSGALGTIAERNGESFRVVWDDEAPSRWFDRHDFHLLTSQSP